MQNADAVENEFVAASEWIATRSAVSTSDKLEVAFHSFVIPRWPLALIPVVCALQNSHHGQLHAHSDQARHV